MLILLISIKIVVSNVLQAFENILIQRTWMAQCISLYLFIYLLHILFSSPSLLYIINALFKLYHYYYIHNIVHIENNKYILCIRLFNSYQNALMLSPRRIYAYLQIQCICISVYMFLRNKYFLFLFLFLFLCPFI